MRRHFQLARDGIILHTLGPCSVQVDGLFGIDSLGAVHYRVDVRIAGEFPGSSGGQEVESEEKGRREELALKILLHRRKPKKHHHYQAVASLTHERSIILAGDFSLYSPGGLWSSPLMAEHKLERSTSFLLAKVSNLTAKSRVWRIALPSPRLNLGIELIGKG
jgi:hypothetical protein